MATVCSHCGKELPRGDSRFCTNCGTLVPDHPLSPHNRVAAQNAPTPTNINTAAMQNNDAQGRQNPGIREQVAQQPQQSQQPNARSAQPGTSGATPWLGLEGQNATPWLGIQGYDVIPQTPLPPTEQRTQREQADQTDKPTERPVERPASMTPPPSTRNNAPQGFQPANPAPAAVPPSSSSAPEALQVEQGSGSEQQAGKSAGIRPGTRASGYPNTPRRPGGRLSRQNANGTTPSDVNAAWPEPLTHVTTNEKQRENIPSHPAWPDLPSTPQPAPQAAAQDIEELPTQAFSKTASDLEELPTQALSHAATDIEEMPTAQVEVANIEKKSPTPNPPSWSGNAPQTPQLPRQPNPASWSGNAPQTPLPNPPSWSGNPAQPGPINWPRDATQQGKQPDPVSWSGNAAAQVASAPIAAPRARNKKLLVLLTIVGFLIIAILAVGAWIVIDQPFTVASATNPLQVVKNSTLGVELTYPSSWQSTHDASSLSLADSSNTGQIKLAMSDAPSGDLTKYLQQQATKVQMANAKMGATQTFAGSTWQQIQGNVQVLGATYTETIAVTVHNNHLYTWSQLAPKVSYADEESLIFAPARSSLKFN